MTITEIPRNEWADFFCGFSQRHKGWLVNTEIVGDEVHGQFEGRQLPLEGITPELGGGADEMEIIVSDRPNHHLSHTVRSPTRVRLHQTAEGADEAVEIQSASETVVVRFRSAMLPEMLDLL
ncbi:MAG TPA: DUF5335 family protein [Blastocatellia bacterium]|nr:DUF5335 family protein [Blastocatellia bacterium]